MPPAGMSTPATEVDPGHAELGPERALVAQRLLDEVRDPLAIASQPVLEVGLLGDDPQCERQQSDRGLLAPGEEVRRQQGNVVHLGHRPVRERGGGHRRHDVVARLAATVLDVAGELLVEELERLVLHVLGQVGQALGEQPVIRLGDAFQVGDHQQRERRRVVADELAPTLLDQLAQLPIGEALHELLVGSQPPGCQQAHHQRSVGGVSRRVERGQLVAERQLVAVALDDVGDVVALERFGERHERSAHHVARRELGRVVVDRQRLVVAGHHEDAVVRLLPHR